MSMHSGIPDVSRRVTNVYQGGLGGLTGLLNAVPLLGGSLGGLGRIGEPKPVAKEELQKPVMIEKKPAMNEKKHAA